MTAVLDANRKKSMTIMEAGTFFRTTGQSKAFSQEIYNYNGCQAKIYTEPSDGQAAEKSTGIKLAIRTVVDNGYTLAGDVRVYCSMAYETQNRAFHRDAGWNSVCWITLNSTVVAGADRDSISQKSNPGFSKVAVTCIHEIGHHLHELSAGDVDFWGTGSDLTGKAKTAGEIGAYAATNIKEFIAEAFASINVGRPLSAAVMREYAKYRGPTPG